MNKGHAAMINEGFLAIWSDIAAERESDYLHWLTREHAHERLGVSGFAAVRVYRLLQSDIRRYFICYELQSADVLGSAAYLARLNEPTPWSRRIMPQLGNFIRGGGTVCARAGHGRGGFLAIVKFGEALPDDGTEIANNVVAMDGIVAARLLRTDSTQTSIRTNEKALRTGDESFAGLLLVEGLREELLAKAANRLGLPAVDGLYTQIFELRG